MGWRLDLHPLGFWRCERSDGFIVNWATLRDAMRYVNSTFNLVTPDTDAEGVPFW